MAGVPPMAEVPPSPPPLLSAGHPQSPDATAQHRITRDRLFIVLDLPEKSARSPADDERILQIGPVFRKKSGSDDCRRRSDCPFWVDSSVGRSEGGRLDAFWREAPYGRRPHLTRASTNAPSANAADPKSAASRGRRGDSGGSFASQARTQFVASRTAAAVVGHAPCRRRRDLSILERRRATGGGTGRAQRGARLTDPGTWKPTACILCECNCGIEVQVGGESGRELVRIRGDRAHPASKGYACEKALRLNHYQNGVQRVQTPLRRTVDGEYEPISWDTAITEIAARLGGIRDAHGGESIFYYGGGGQGNHLPGAYARATLHALGVRYRSNALAQEKTGEFWVAGQMMGHYVRGDFEHCEVGIFLGKNPWHSHGIARARVTLKAMAKDPERTLIVVDPRRSETADLADIHLQVKPGTDAWLVQGLVATFFQEGLLATDWLDQHTEGLEDVRPFFADVSIARCAEICGIPAPQIRDVARRIARAKSVSVFEDLGVQMNRNSTLVSYLQRLLWLLTGHFAKEGCAYIPTSFQPLARHSTSDRRSPVAGARIIAGLVPCNVIAEEILTDHPKRYRAMIVEAANPAHSLADSQHMRAALGALDCLVVIDVAMTETARLADYVLPTASQFEKGEVTFFNFEFPENYFHFRQPVLEPPPGVLAEPEIHARLVEALGAMPTALVETLSAASDKGRDAFRNAFFGAAMTPQFSRIAPVVLYRAMADRLGPDRASAAVLYALSSMYAMSEGQALARAGIEGPGHELGDRLFDAILESPHGLVFAVNEWAEIWGRVPGGKVQLRVPVLDDALTALDRDAGPARDDAFPFMLTAGERRSFTANTIFRDPQWRKKDREGALRLSPQDGRALGIEDGGVARVTTRRGSVAVRVQITDRMQPGHASLPNGMGLSVPSAKEDEDIGGIAPNELTASEDRDFVAGTPWHKSVPAQIEAV